MKKQHFISILAVAALLTGMSCQHQQRDVRKYVEFENFHAEQTYRLDGSAQIYEAGKDLGFFCTANLLMPVAVGEHDISALRDSILSAAFDTTGTDINEVFSAAMARAAGDCSGFRAVTAEIPDSVCEGWYGVNGFVGYMTPRVMCYGVTVSFYAPRAAHGMHTTYYTNYDIEKNRIFTLSDLFTAEGLASLPEVLKQTVHNMPEIDESTVEGLPSKDNFFIDSNGNIVFVYQPYEIASYAQGIINIPVPAYQLSGSLTDYGRDILL